MKTNRNFFLFLLLVMTFVPFVANAQKESSSKGSFADICWFKNKDTMRAFIREYQLQDVAGCSDAVGNERMFLIVPASDDVRLELFVAVTDSYGNVEPNYDISLGQAEVGKALYFVANFVDGKMNVVVEAVGGVGNRAYWSPMLHPKDHKLMVNEEFGCMLVE